MTAQTLFSTGAQTPAPHPFPVNFPAVELLKRIRDARICRFEAVPIPPGSMRSILGTRIMLPVCGWTIWQTYGLERKLVAMGLDEDDAKERARLLNTPTAPTGMHYAN